jgi:hypothetical protein
MPTPTLGKRLAAAGVRPARRCFKQDAWSAGPSLRGLEPVPTAVRGPEPINDPTNLTVLQMKTLICGSIAYDSIMVFQGRFKEHILPDQVHILNVSFLVPSLRKEFGGIAGNIAYNLALLHGEPLPMGTVGDDGAQYLQRFDDLHRPALRAAGCRIAYGAGLHHHRPR